MSAFPRAAALAPLAALALCEGPAEEIAWAPAEGIALERSFSAQASYTLDELRTELDGQPHPDGSPDLTVESDERIVVTDVLEEVGGGRPLRLVRSFDTLEREVVYRSEQAEEDLEESRGCDLEGHTVVLRWDEDAEEYVAEPAEGEEIDEDLLADLFEDMDLRELLPTGEVEVGDEWEVDPLAYARLMWPGGLLPFHAEDEAIDAADTENDRQLLENLEGTGTVTLEDLREEDGTPIAVLGVRFDVSSEATGEEESERGPSTRTLRIERTIEGSVHWDLEAGHLVSGELQAEASLEVREEGSFETPDGREIDVLQVRSFEGTISYTIEIAPAG